MRRAASKRWLAALLLSAGLICSSFASEDAEGDVAIGDATGTDTAAIVLTEADFEMSVNEGKDFPWFVKFYAPWCGHCKTLAPIWEELAIKVSDVAKVAMVDATQAHTLADDYDADGFPTLKLITESKVYTYSGKRVQADLEAWVRGGWRDVAAEPLPKDRPWEQKMIKKFFKFLWTYGLPAAALASVGLAIWMMRDGAPTEEEIQRRRDFEQKLEEYERRIAEKRQRSDSTKKPAEDEKGAKEAEQDAAEKDEDMKKDD